jgi:hypothetical protein
LSVDKTTEATLALVKQLLERTEHPSDETLQLAKEIQRKLEANLDITDKTLQVSVKNLSLHAFDIGVRNL